MPPKKQQNYFYWYMMDFQDVQKKRGINYGNLKDLADACGPAWKLEPPEVRAKYEAKAKAAKQKSNVLEKKYTSHGVPLSMVINAQLMQLEMEEAEKRDVKNIVTSKKMQNQLLDEDFYIIDVNSYCKLKESYFLIGEIALLRFSVRNGIGDFHQQLVEPGNTPIGYASDVKIGAQELGLPMPGEGPRTSPAQVLALMIDYLRRHRPDARLPPVFTVADKVPQVKSFIHDLCEASGEDEDIFRVYHLHLLMHELVSAVSAPGEAYPEESISLMQLKADKFMYSPGLGCEHHERGSVSVQCSLARAQRWAFTILDTTCARAAIRAVPARHVPQDYDVDGIIAFRETHPPPDNAWATADANSTLDSTLTNADKPSKPKRVHAPLRAPRADYGQVMRAPTMTADVPVMFTGTGRKKGPGTPGAASDPADSFARMKM